MSRGHQGGFLNKEHQTNFEKSRDENIERLSLAYLTDAVEAYGLDHVAGLAGVPAVMIAAAIKDQKIGPLKGPIMGLVRKSTSTRVDKLRGIRAARALGGEPQKPARTGGATTALAGPVSETWGQGLAPAATAGPAPEPGTFTAQVEAQVFRTVRGNKGVPLTLAALARAVGLVEGALGPMLSGMVDRGVLGIAQGKGYTLPKAKEPAKPASNGQDAKLSVEVRALREATEGHHEALWVAVQGLRDLLGPLERKLDVLIGLQEKILGHVGPVEQKAQVPQ